MKTSGKSEENDDWISRYIQTPNAGKCCILLLKKKVQEDAVQRVGVGTVPEG